MVSEALFTVPFPRHPHFFGREQELADLHAALQEEQAVGITPALGLTGQGGIGKTQLAVEYCYRYRDHYPDGVFWLNAANDLRVEFAQLGEELRRHQAVTDAPINRRKLLERLRQQFDESELRDLCFELNIRYGSLAGQSADDKARELVLYCERAGRLAELARAMESQRPHDSSTSLAQDELIALVFNKLQKQPNCLLVLDNVAEPVLLDRPIIRQLTPADLPCRMLFSTRQRELGRFRPLGMTTLPQAAALELLLRDKSRHPIRHAKHPEHSTALAICATLGYLPLALEIAGAHLGKKQAPLVRYYEELKRRGAIDVLEDPRVSVQTIHEIGLAATLNSQWETISNEGQLLLRVAGQLPEAAYLPAARLGLLAGIPDAEEAEFFAVTLQEVLAELEKASLIEELRGEEVRLHPLVREFARRQTPLAEKEAFRRACVRRMVDGLTTITTLEAQCDRRGIGAIVGDLLVAQRWLANQTTGAETTAELDKRLGGLLRLLRREAHHLWEWRQQEKAFLAQQLMNRQLVAGLGQIVSGLAGHLRQTGSPFWALRWSARRESAQLEQTLSGHASGVNGVALTTDGQRAVSASSDGTLKVWNLETGAVEQTLSGHAGWVRDVALTADGQRAVLASDDGTLKVWNLETGEMDQILRGHTGEVNGVAVSADGRRAVSASSDSTLKVWNLGTGEVEQTLSGHAGWVNNMALTVDGRWAVSASSDSTLKVWNLETGEMDQTLSGHAGAVLGVALTADGRRVVSASSDGTLKVWNLETGEVEQTLSDHAGAVLDVAVSADGWRAVSTSDDGTLKVWNLGTGEVEQTLSSHADFVWGVALTVDGQRAVLACDDGTLEVWNLDSREVEQTLSGHASRVWDVALTTDGQRAVSASDDGTLKVWNLDTGAVEQTLSGHTDWVWGVAVSADGQRAVSASADCMLKVWNLETGEELARVAVDGAVFCVAVVADPAVARHGERTLMVFTGDGTGNVYYFEYVETGERVESGE